MTTEHHRSSSGFFTKLFALAFLLLLIAGIGSYAMGWLTLEQNGDTTTVEVNTGEMRQAASEAGEAGREALDSAADGLRETGDELKESVNQ